MKVTLMLSFLWHFLDSHRGFALNRLGFLRATVLLA